MNQIKKAVITAAGWGTRFLPVTKSQPKEMLPLLNKPLIQYSVEEAVACGAELVIIVTSIGKKPMEDYFDRAFELEHSLETHGKTELAKEIRRLSEMADICYVRQKEQLGLGHAVLTAKRVVGDEPFLLLLPDDIFEQRERVLEQMVEVHHRFGGSVISMKEVPEKEVDRYGIIKSKKLEERIHEVQDLVEKPSPAEAPSRMAIMGRYVITPDIFEALENTPPGRNQEIQITDALRRLARAGRLRGFEFEGERYDAGTQQGWLETNLVFALKDPETGPKLREFIAKLL